MRLSPRRPVLIAALAAASVAGYAATAALAPVAAVRADDTADQIAALDEVVKAGDDPKVIAKLTELEAKLDPAITDAILKLARAPKTSDRVFKTALKICAQRKDAGTFSYLKAKLKDDKMAEDHPEKFYAVLDSLAFFGDKADKAVTKGLEDVVKANLPKSSGIASRAITAYGTIREFPVVTQLIEWLLETEKTKGGGQSSTPGKGGGLGAETKKNYEETKPSVLKALGTLTGQSFAAGPDWQKWWKDSKEKCEWPSADAAAEPDWATLNEYVDKAYGFTLKKPDDGNKFWHFVKPEDKARAQLENRDDKGLLNARCKVMVYSDSGGTYKDAEAFAKYFMDDSFNLTKDFAQWAQGGEAKIEEKLISGRKFSVLRGKGQAKDRWKNWDSCERRIYITCPSTHVFLYFECAVRNAWDQPLIDAFWKDIDNVQFKAPVK